LTEPGKIRTKIFILSCLVPNFGDINTKTGTVFEDRRAIPISHKVGALSFQDLRNRIRIHLGVRIPDQAKKDQCWNP
jgi:hypothetical protein